MTTRLKFSEHSPRAELRRWRKHENIVIGCIFSDRVYEYEDGQHIVVRNAEMRDYKDHFIIISPDGDYYKALKKEERDR